MEYLYSDNNLWPEDDRDRIKVESGTLVCFDVEAVGPSSLGLAIVGSDAKAWTFSVRGMTGRFRTNYDWALVRHDRTNAARTARILALDAQRTELTQEVNRIFKEMDTAAKDLKKE